MLFQRNGHTASTLLAQHKRDLRKRLYEPGTRLTAKPIWADDSFSLQFLDALEEKLVWLASLVNLLVKPNFLPKSMFTFLVKRIWTKPAYACFLNSGFV
jgi:hypothetical protein